MVTEVIENVATSAVLVTALIVTAIAARAWMYTRSTKVLLLATGFALFLVKAVVLSIGLFVIKSWGTILLPVSVSFDLAILGVFYLAVLKRSST